MLRRGKYSQSVKEAIRSAEGVLPASGEVEAMLDHLSARRGRPVRLLTPPLPEGVSGALMSTEQADYVAVSKEASPERQVSVVCHEVAHMLLGHDHHGSLSSSLVNSGLLSGVDPELAKSVVAGRQAYAATVETDAELVATYISVELRKRVMRGGNTHFDEHWQ